MTDERIGKMNADGSRSMPNVNVRGAAYESSASIHFLDDVHFVVLPVNFVDNGELDALRALVQPPPAEPIVRKRKGDDENV